MRIEKNIRLSHHSKAKHTTPNRPNAQQSKSHNNQTKHTKAMPSKVCHIKENHSNVYQSVGIETNDRLSQHNMPYLKATSPRSLDPNFDFVDENDVPACDLGVRTLLRVGNGVLYVGIYVYLIVLDTRTFSKLFGTRTEVGAGTVPYIGLAYTSRLSPPLLVIAVFPPLFRGVSVTGSIW
jgi:hypothetical protein